VQTDSSLDRLLKSLDVEKYSINFQAEEACLTYLGIQVFHVLLAYYILLMLNHFSG
jgi:hypothetical protein